MDKRSIVIIVAFCIITAGAILASYQRYMVNGTIMFETEGFTLEEEE